MLKKALFTGLVLLLVAGGVGFFPALTQAQQDTGSQPPAGEANFIFINYIGQALNLDLDDVSYVIPGTATVPEGGKLTLGRA